MRAAILPSKSKISSGLLCSSAASLALLSLAPSTARAQGLESLAPTPESRIVGGTEVTSCQWPSTVVVITRDASAPKDRQTRLCTGSLLHPEVVITAAHCLAHEMIGIATTASYEMLFEDKDKKLFYEIESCKAHPKWVNDKVTQGQNLDFAYCKLKRPIKDVPIVPPLMGCELDILKPTTPITLVGYGQQDGGPTSAPGFKYEVKTTFNGYSSSGEAQAGSQGKGSCYGDSGGPAYVHLKGERFGQKAGWRVFGVTSFGPRGCPGPATYGMMNTFMEFVEKETKLDLTPCFDAKGEWDPNEKCKGDPLDPRQSKGSWLEQSCEHGPEGGWINTCGDPAGGDSGSGGDSGDSGESESAGSDSSSESSSESESGDSGDSDSGDSGNDTSDKSQTPKKSESADSKKQSPSDKSATPQKSPKEPKKSESEPSAKKPNAEDPPQGGDNGGGCVVQGALPSAPVALLGLGLLGLVRRRKRA